MVASNKPLREHLPPTEMLARLPGPCPAGCALGDRTLSTPLLSTRIIRQAEMGHNKKPSGRSAVNRSYSSSQSWNASADQAIGCWGFNTYAVRTVDTWLIFLRLDADVDSPFFS
jgi:hypothetical protein